MSLHISEYKRQRRLGMISLEYYDVIRNTSCQEFMIRAHSTKCLQPEALMLWVKICIKHSIATKDFAVRWTSKCRARGGRKYGCGYIKLNTNYLTIGQVLHEMAHVIQFNNFRNFKPHGKEFIQIFDLLLIEFYSGQLN